MGSECRRLRVGEALDWPVVRGRQGGVRARLVAGRIGDRLRRRGARLLLPRRPVVDERRRNGDEEPHRHRRGAGEEHPVWAPDGDEIAYASTTTTTGRASIWRMDPDGTHRSRVPNTADAANPDWRALPVTQR